jgi:hypothetical protein
MASNRPVEIREERWKTTRSRAHSEVKDMNDRRTKILSSNLHGLIPVGNCEETIMLDEKTEKRLQTVEKSIDLLLRNQESFEKVTNEKIINIAKMQEKHEKTVGRLSAVLQKIMNKLNNGWGETLTRHEECLKEKVDYQDLNGAINSVRNEVKTLKWIFGLSFPAVLGALVTLVIMGMK